MTNTAILSVAAIGLGTIAALVAATAFPAPRSSAQIECNTVEIRGDDSGPPASGDPGTPDGTAVAGAGPANVGQQIKLKAKVTPAGATVTAYQWTVPGSIIKDYEERLDWDETATPNAPNKTWSVTPMVAADFQQSTISYYWKNTGNFKVSLQATTPNNTCTNDVTINVERNGTDPNKQADDFYTEPKTYPANKDGDHIDRVACPAFPTPPCDHPLWHTNNPFGIPFGACAPRAGEEFFVFHRHFLDRFDRWRAEFGYPPILVWYPGDNAPRGKDMEHERDGAAGLTENDFAVMDHLRGFHKDSPFHPNVAHTHPGVDLSDPTDFDFRYLTRDGGGATSPCHLKTKLADFTADQLGADTEGPWHNGLHC